MDRDELLTNLAMELDPADWPIEAVGKQVLALRPAPEHVIELYGCKAVAFTYEQYLQRRAELINKPGWDDAPEWAEWQAQDEDGHWHWYDAKPDAFDRQWDSNHGDRVSRAGPGTIPNGHDWRQTLERRPAFNESRADIIGQNGNDGHHYAGPLTHGELPAEEKYDCLCCGGEYWTPPHEYCPCLDMFRHNVEETFAPLPEKGRAGGLKFDANKPRMELLIQGMPRALEAVGQVLTFGAQKYEAHSWQHVEDNHNRYWAAKSRHELARAKGETHDPETGLLHLAHEACNALFLLELALMDQDSED